MAHSKNKPHVPADNPPRFDVQATQQPAEASTEGSLPAGPERSWQAQFALAVLLGGLALLGCAMVMDFFKVLLIH